MPAPSLPSWNAVKVRERRRDTIRVEVKTLGATQRAATRDTADIRSELMGYLNNWRDIGTSGLPRHDG